MFFEKINSQQKKETLRDLAFYAAVATIPFHNNLNSWSIVVFCVTAFFLSPLRDVPKKLIDSRFWMLSAAYFLWLGLTYFWDSSGGFTFKDLERYSGFIVFPFVFTVISKIPLRTIYRGCMLFAVVIAVIGMICLVKSYREYSIAGDYRVFAYHYLAMQMDLNAVILSNYCLESIAWLIFFSINAPDPVLKPSKIFASVVGAFLSLMIFLLSSKLIIFLLILLIVGSVAFLGLKKKKLSLTILLLSVFIGVSFVLINKLPYLKWRISAIEFRQYRDQQDDQNGFAARLLMWQSGLELVRQKPFLGYGLVGSKQELFKKYEEKKFELGALKRYNVHNQFIETTLSSGLIGLAIYIAILFAIGLESLREKKWLLLIIFTHYLCMSMVESSLDVQQEIVFFLFFIFLFYFHLPPKKRIPVSVSGQLPVRD